MMERALNLEDGKALGERPVLATESYRETEGYPMIIRQAKALENVLMREGVSIGEDDLLAGSLVRQKTAHPGISEEVKRRYPEAQLNFVEFTGAGRFDLSRASPGLREALEYWRGRPTLHEMVRRARSPEDLAAQNGGVYSAGGLVDGHTLPDFERVLREGFRGLRAEAERRMGNLDPTDPESVRRRRFYEAARILCDAAVKYAQRYAHLAKEMAQREQNPERREELLRMAEICSWVPANPARSFREALQSVWFTHLIHMSSFGDVGGPASLGRLDQYLYPYYRRDLEQGKITREEALELIEHLWVKLYRQIDFQHVMIGGVRPDGKDGTNELSYICLEATEKLPLHRDIAARIHRNTPQEFLLRCCEVIKSGSSMLALWNDEVMVPALVEKGVSLEDARDYAVVGCVEVCIPGRSDPRTMAHNFNITKCLELALNNGRCMLTGEQLGPETGEPENFATFDQVMEALRAQISYFVRLAVGANIAAEVVQAEVFPTPLISLLTEGCLETGLDMTAGGARYNFTSPCLTGVANVADSLAALKKLVFEDKAVSMQELVEALRSNFDGRERLRQVLITRAPKFGNDEDCVDDLAREAVLCYCRELEKYRNARQGPFNPLIFGTTSANVKRFGKVTAATPDGRRAGEALAMSVAPSPGVALRGPTAALKSIAKVDYSKTPGGVSCIIDLHPTAVSGARGTEVLASLVRTFFDLGGCQISFNIVDEKTLREAQREPERYRHLVVRVFGYSDYFVNLDRELQEYVITRTCAGNP